MPKPETEGYVQDHTSGTNLGHVLNVGKKNVVSLHVKKKKPGQKWLRSKEDSDGWFTLKNPFTGKFLALGIDQLIVSGMYAQGFVLKMTTSAVSLEQLNVLHEKIGIEMWM